MAKREVIVELRLEDQNAVQRLGRLEIETKGLQTELRLLNAEIRKNGVATKEQQLRVGELTAKIRANQGVTRELKNDLSGLTDAGLRFRDKMADAAKAGLGAFGLNILGVTAGVTALAGVVRNAVGTVIDFDQALAGIRALGGEYAANIDAIAEAAKTVGINFGFTATETLGAVEALAKAGVSVSDILGGSLEGALTLAAAGQLSVADAAETASKAMTQFGLSGEDIPHLADLLAAGAASATGEVTDFAQALNQSGLVASQAGISIEETVGTLTAFASAGLIGSDAGTSFRTMLLRLQNPSKESADTMERLGLEVFDAQGQFIGLEKLAGQLQTQLADLTEEQRSAALAQIFGTDAVRAANVLYTQGAKGIREYTQQVDQSGFASGVATEQTNSLKGSLDRLNASWESFILNIDKGDGAFSSFVKDAIDGISALLSLISGAEDASVVDFTKAVQGEYNKLGGTLELVAEKGDKVVDEYRLINDELKNFGATAESIALLEARANITRRELAALQGRQLTEQERIQAAAAAALLANIRARQEEIRQQIALSKANRDTGDAAKQAGDAAVEAHGRAFASAGHYGSAIRELRESYLKFIDEINTANFETLQTRLPEGTPRGGPVGVEDPQFFQQDLQGTEDLATAKTILMENYYGRLSELKREDFATEQEFVNAKKVLYEDYMAYRKELEEQYRTDTVQQAGNLFGSISALAAEGSAEQKAFAIAAAIANTYVGVTKALAELTPPASYLAAAATVAQGLAAVQRIRSTSPQFAEGGFTTPGPKYKPAGVVHAGEWVAPAWQVNHPSFAPVIDWLEEQRKARGGATSVPYAAGGLVRGVAMVNAAPTLDLIQIENAVAARLAMDRPMQVDVMEINKAQGRVRVADTLATA